MIPEQLVEVRWSGRNKKYYEEKGYTGYNRNNTFMVNIKDLSANSHVYILAICDQCGKEYKTRQQTYNARKTENNYCAYCAKAHLLPRLTEQRIGVKSVLALDENVAKGYSKRAVKEEDIISKYKEAGFEVVKINKVTTQAKNWIIDFVCTKHQEEGIQSKTYNLFYQNPVNKGCRGCQRDQNSGYGSPGWKDGRTPILLAMRNTLFKWAIDSMKACNYRCILTGAHKEKCHVHHYKINKSKIFDTVLKELGIDKRGNLSDLTQTQLSQLEKRCLDLHYEIGLGVLIRKDLHIEFHKKYGRVNNTEEQWNEFVEAKKKELMNIA